MSKITRNGPVNLRTLIEAQKGFLLALVVHFKLFDTETETGSPQVQDTEPQSHLVYSIHYNKEFSQQYNGEQTIIGIISMSGPNVVDRIPQYTSTQRTKATCLRTVKSLTWLA